MNEGVFGVWDAPMTDDLPQIPTPVGEKCGFCGETIEEGDNGAVTMGMGPQHRECCLRSVLGGIGHHVNHAKFCHGPLGPDAGLPYRASAVLVWFQHHGRLVVTEELIEVVRALRSVA